MAQHTAAAQRRQRDVPGKQPHGPRRSRALQRCQTTSRRRTGSTASPSDAAGGCLLSCCDPFRCSFTAAPSVRAEQPATTLHNLRGCTMGFQHLCACTCRQEGHNAPGAGPRDPQLHLANCLSGCRCCRVPSLLSAPVGKEATMRQAPPPATRSRTSHCATAARRSSGPARAAMPAAAALCTSMHLSGQLVLPAFECFRISSIDQGKCCWQSASCSSLI
jgi:hypothetical protein